ncbi:MAG: cytochrome c biosis protein CcmG, thiol:disulfide interchange protein DsbE [Acidobacteriota bacterium]|nr:cytochrome c biosis protein CcmG, thiol:disulfide interchange protein DsbE [Acidobacteriota bacterium]
MSQSSRSFLMRRCPSVVVCALAGSVALLLLLSACGTTDYTASQGSSAASNRAATDTPQGAKLPRTALPMPPVATAHEGATTNAPGGIAVVNASTWTTLDGRRTRGSDFQGKVLILDFWATYCPPCRDEVPHLIALQRRYGAQGLQVVGLNVGGDEDRPKVPAFIEEFGIQYALGYPDAQMSELFFADNSAIPQTYIYDRQGRLLKKFVGFDDRMGVELERAVQAALAEKPAAGED